MSSYRYRFIRSSWGIAVDLQAALAVADAPAPGAIEAAPGCGWHCPRG